MGNNNNLKINKNWKKMCDHFKATFSQTPSQSLPSGERECDDDGDVREHCRSPPPPYAASDPNPHLPRL